MILKCKRIREVADFVGIPSIEFSAYIESTNNPLLRYNK